MPNIITRGAMSAKAVGFTGQTTTPVYIEDVFSTYLYTGNGSTQTITNDIDLSTKGGMVWIKYRNVAANHCIFDTSRGANYIIQSNNTNQSYLGASLTSFNTNGFSLGSGGLTFRVNANGGLFTSWSFRKQPKFFTQLAYTGTGTATTISHDLGCVPGMIIVKRTDTTGDWQVYHSGLTSASYSIQLNLTNAQALATTVWNSTAPTSSVFSVGTDATVNASGGTYVAYLFADSSSGGFGLSGTDSVVACGSYSGSSSTVSVTLGWEPQWLLIKKVTNNNAALRDWLIVDNMRGLPVLPSYASGLFPNTTGAETTNNEGVHPSSTGFTLDGSFDRVNNSGETYIYVAIRRGPMKTPTDATKVFAPVIGQSASPAFPSGFPVDLGIYKNKPTGSAGYVNSRLTGNVVLQTTNTSAESADGAGFDQQSGWYPSASTAYVGWAFRRAPGFFDVVCYTGTGSARTVAHNLGVVPELMIVKRRDGAGTEWCVYSQSILNNQYLVLNTFAAKTGVGALTWNSTTPTASVFSLGTYSGVNASGGTYVAYLFATCPGVSKCGSYTGTGAAQNIDCGFASSARFILIKRTDSTGDWWVYDSARGISASNDPYLFMNSTAAEVTNTNYVDAFASGFTITSAAPAGINASGGSYIFLAVA